MGKFLRCIPGTQHKDPLRSGKVFCGIVWQHVVTHDALVLNHIEQRHTHRTLGRRSIRHRRLVVLQPPSDIDGREVDGVAPQNMFRLDGGQHGVGPAKLRLPLILDRCHR